MPAAYYNPNTYTLDWYDWSTLPVEIILSVTDVNGMISGGGIFYLQDVRKQRLEAQKEEKPA